jgi:hypothetical protein
MDGRGRSSPKRVVVGGSDSKSVDPGGAPAARV